MTTDSNATFDAGGKGRVLTVGSGTTRVTGPGLMLTNGRSDSGGGVSVLSGATAVISTTTIAANSATFSGGGIATDGALTLINSTVRNNNQNIPEGGTPSESGGGALYVGNGNGSKVTIEASTLNNNTADRGGGIYQAGGTLDARNMTISGNTARSSGGGIWHAGGNATVRFATIAYNAASAAAEPKAANIHNAASGLDLLRHDHQRIGRRGHELRQRPDRFDIERL